jgi:pentatricopeptide repeat protein
LFSSTGELERAKEIASRLEKEIESSIHPNKFRSVLLSTLCEAYLRAGDYVTASNYFAEMRQNNYSLNPEICFLYIDLISKRANTEAIQTLRTSLESQMKTGLKRISKEDEQSFWEMVTTIQLG